MLKFSNELMSIFIKRSLLILLGLACYFYSLYTSDFAEWHIKLWQLDFPIFIGEILLFICVFGLAIYWYFARIQINRKFLIVLILYIIWLLTKTFFGYQFGGPLALRNAAIFYYPFFVLISFFLFDFTYLKSHWRWSVLAFSLVNLCFIGVNDYFAIAYVFLAIGLCLELRQNRIKIIGFLIIAFYIYQSKFLWWGVRSHMVGLGVMSIFLSGYFLFGISRIGMRLKVLITIFLAIFLMSLLFRFGDQNALKSMISFRHLSKQYENLNKEIALKRKNYIAESLPPQLYHQNPRVVKHLIKSDSTIVKNTSSVNSPLAKGIPNSISSSASSSFSVTEVNSDPSLNLNPGAFEPQKFSLQNREKKSERSLEIAYSNIFFRIFIWRDMAVEMINQHAWWGVSFGLPQRSVSMEILDWAPTEWRRDGWITPHNSFLHMIYRGGIIGFICVIALFCLIVNMVLRFFNKRSVWGGLLMACIVYWMGISNFLVFLEFPYNAIPFWTFLGLTLGYLHFLEKPIDRTGKNHG